MKHPNVTCSIHTETAQTHRCPDRHVLVVFTYYMSRSRSWLSLEMQSGRGEFRSSPTTMCTTTPVVCRWAWAIFVVTNPFGQEQYGHRIKIIKKVKCDWQTNRPTTWTVGQTKWGVESRSTRLKFCIAIKPLTIESWNLKQTIFLTYTTPTQKKKLMDDQRWFFVKV